MTKSLALILGLLPASRIKNVLLRWLCGYIIEPGVRIYPCLLLNVRSLTLREGAVVGLLTTLRDLHAAELGRGAAFGNFNWITAADVLSDQSPRASTIKLGDGAAITSRHYIDCSGGVEVGRFSTVAGVRSVFFSHGIDVDSCEQVASPISIGEFCLISSAVRVVPGVSIADRCLVAMGSVVARNLDESDCLYAGVPAAKKRKVAGHYFTRAHAFVRGRASEEVLLVTSSDSGRAKEV